MPSLREFLGLGAFVLAPLRRAVDLFDPANVEILCGSPQRCQHRQHDSGRPRRAAHQGCLFSAPKIKLRHVRYVSLGEKPTSTAMASAPRLTSFSSGSL